MNKWNICQSSNSRVNLTRQDHQHTSNCVHLIFSLRGKKISSRKKIVKTQHKKRSKLQNIQIKSMQLNLTCHNLMPLDKHCVYLLFLYRHSMQCIMTLPQFFFLPLQLILQVIHLQVIKNTSIKITTPPNSKSLKTIKISKNYSF